MRALTLVALCLAAGTALAACSELPGLELPDTTTAGGAGGGGSGGGGGTTTTTTTTTTTATGGMGGTATGGGGMGGGPLNWTDDVEPLMNVANGASGTCLSCHNNTSLDEGNYSVDSYMDAFGPGSDGTPNIIAGDHVASALWTRCNNGHRSCPPTTTQIIADWIDSGAAEN